MTQLYSSYLSIMNKSSNQNEKDDLKSFLLRARLSDMNFSHVWRAMPSLGWKFNGAEYISPDGINLGTSLIAMERLDKYALPFLTIRKREAQDEGEKDNDIKLRRTRNDLLVGIFANLDSKSRRFEIDSSDDGESNCDDNSNDDSPPNQQGWQSAKPAQEEVGYLLPLSSRASATTNEPGTEQYFHRHKPRRSKRVRETQLLFTTIQAEHNKPSSKKTEREDEKKGKDRKEKKHKASRKVDNENVELAQEKDVVIQMTKIDWPTPTDNVKNIQALKNEQTDEIYVTKSRQYLHSHASEWKFLLSTNHCLLFHGFGSKRLLLNEFATELKASGDVLTLDGNDSDISISSILDVVVDLFLDGIEPDEKSSQYGYGLDENKKHVSNNIIRATAISETLGMNQENPIYIIIHNIDGMQLRNHDAQSALAALVMNSHAKDSISSPATCTTQQENSNERLLRLVASVDHVDAALFLWDTDLLQQFSWIWKRTDTLFPYYEEVKAIVSDESRKIKAIHQNEALDFIFMQKVLKSLAPKYEQILKILGNLQLSNVTDSGGVTGSVSSNNNSNSNNNNNTKAQGFVDYKEWKKKCFENIVTNKEGELKNMMKELIDHKMIERKVDESEGKEYIRIPASKHKVRQILKAMEKKD